MKTKDDITKEHLEVFSKCSDEEKEKLVFLLNIEIENVVDK